MYLFGGNLKILVKHQKIYICIYIYIYIHIYIYIYRKHISLILRFSVNELNQNHILVHNFIFNNRFAY